MASENQVGLILSNSLPWRKTTALHRDNGAMAIRSAPPLIMSAGVPITLFSGPYGAGSIDRIIGFSLRFGGLTGPGTLVLADLLTGFTFPIQAGSHFGNYQGNIETTNSFANITLVSSLGVTAAMNCSWSLYNFEVVPGEVGHYG